MSGPRKRPRVLNGDALHEKVLSAFHNVLQPERPDSEGPKKKSNLPLSFAKRYSKLEVLCEQLVCVSKEEGQSSISQLKKEIQGRACSPAEVATHLFAIDDIDFLPPLCALTSLLENACLRLKDLDQSLILQRAVYEVECAEACVCRGSRTGIRSLINIILDESRGVGQDSLLNTFVSILFNDGAHVSRSLNRIARIKLAEIVLNCLRNEMSTHGDRGAMLLSWIRQSSLPSRVASDESNESNSVLSTIWTPELSGLATGRSPSEYLETGDSEERALLTLYSSVDPAHAALVYLECINLLLQFNSDKKVQRRATGSWSRVVLLGRRIRDIKLFADVDVGLGRSTESSITGALCSPSSLSDNHAIAVLLCLCRRLFLHVWKSEKGDDSNRQFTDYETWFREVVGKNKGKLVEGLMKPLTELVPLEPLNFLRVHHRIFSMKRDYFRITSDYLVLVRSRISDLDPSHNRGFLANADSNMGKSNLDNTEVSSKTIEHVVRFVVEFSEKKKLSPFLVRQMNFHRYHFRANTLPVLLDPNLVSRIEEDKVAGLTMNIDTFEKHRICLIKELAFKRKDQAVVASEATPAVKAIQESTKKRKEHMKEKENKSDVAVEKPLYDLDSPLQELFSSTLRKTEAGHGSEKAFLRDSNYAKSVLLKKLKGAVKDCKQESDYSSLAVNILQNLISAIIENDVGNVTKNLMHLQKNGCSSPLQGYREWWWSIGTLMQPLLRELFGDPDMRCLQKQLQYQLFALVCIRGDCVSTKAMRAVALLTSTLMKLRANVKLSDICYTVTDTCSPKIRFISSIMFDCLPLNEAKYVVCSARFAFHYSSLLLASGEEAQSALKNTVVGDVAYCSPSIDDDKVPLPPFPGPNPPLNLLRWVVANPWRLFLDEGMNEETVRDKLLSGNLAWFLKDIAHLLTSSEADINGGIGVCTYLEFEGRCRWGRANAVYTALRGFEEAGMCRRNLINEAAACIARCQFSTHASCEWIEQGLVRFSEERPSCLKGEPKDNEEENFSAQFVEHCIDEDGPHYSLRMIGIFSLVECCYFHGCVLSYVKHHLEIILLPCFWPLSRQHARFLLTCLNCPSLSGTFPNDENALDISFLMVSNFIVECNENELENWNCNRSQKGMRSKCQSENIAIDHMTGIKSAVKALMLPENEKNTQNPNGTQGFGGIGCVFESFHQSIASSLVLHFVKYYMYAKKDETRHVMRMCCRQLSIIVSGLIAGEVIDVAMSCAALLPFSGRYAARGDHEAALSVMNVLLEVLIDERLQLVDAGAPCPHWVLNFLEAQVDDDDSRMIILSWLGKADEQAGRRRLCVASNLPVSICMGRILGVVNSLCEERISVLVSEAGEDAIARSLLPNMLTVYKELSETLYNRRGTLTSESHARLLGCREHVRCGVVDAFVRIVSNMWERGIERFEDFIGRVFVRFPDVDEEIKVVLRARNVLL